MKKFSLKPFLPHIVAIGIFLVLTITYFSPAVFKGQDMRQGDVTNVKGWQKELKDFHQETGEYSDWSGSMFCGQPANSVYKEPAPNIFSKFGQVFRFGMSSLHLGILILYMLGFYVLVLALGGKPWLGIIGAIAYTFASYNLIIIEAGHVNKGLAMAMMAPVLAGIILCYKRKYIVGVLLTLLATGMNVMYSHQQISYYLILIIVFLAAAYFVEALRKKEVKSFFISSAILLSVAGLSTLPNMGELMPTYDYSKETMRGGSVLKNNLGGEKESSGLEIDYAFAWSYGKMETMTLLVPNFMGGSSHYDLGKDSETYKVLRSSGQADAFVKNTPMYWGTQPFTSGPSYAGAIVCFLFVLGLFIIKGPEKWWTLLVTILAILMAWGKNLPWLNDFLFYHLPLYNKFRVPAMILVITGVSMPLLGILAIKEFFEKISLKDAAIKAKLKKDLLYSFSITGGLCLLLAMVGSGFSFISANDSASLPDWLWDAIRADRKSLLIRDCFRSFFFIAGAFGLMYFLLQNKIKSKYVMIGLGLLIFVDLWSVDRRFVNDDDFTDKRRAKEILPTEANLLILEDKDPHYRVLNMTVSPFNDATTSYFHHSIGGYSATKLRRYQDIIDFHFSQGINTKVLNMLNARYFIVPSQEGSPQVQKNVAALGNAWLVDQLKWVDSPDEEIRALSYFEPADTAVIEKIWQNDILHFKGRRDSSASIKMLSYLPNKIVYQFEGSKTQFAVFSEVFYPKTWKVFINGKESKHFRVNYILRGMELEPGKYQIVFVCHDEFLELSKKISLYSSFFVGAFILLLVGLGIRKKLRKKISKS